MGVVIEPSCTACDRIWPTCSIGNANSFVAVCHDCRNIVNAKRNGFRKSLKPCPSCQCDLESAELLDVFNAKPSKLFRCPRCDADAVSFRTVMHFSFAEYPSPEIGEHVHAEDDNGKLDVPGLWLRSTDVTCNGMPRDWETKTVELKVVRKKMQDGSLKAIEFEFVRFVD